MSANTLLTDCCVTGSAAALTVDQTVQLIDQTISWLAYHPGQHMAAAVTIRDAVNSAAMAITPVRVALQHAVAVLGPISRPLVQVTASVGLEPPYSLLLYSFQLPYSLLL